MRYTTLVFLLSFILEGVKLQKNHQVVFEETKKKRRFFYQDNPKALATYNQSDWILGLTRLMGKAKRYFKKKKKKKKRLGKDKRVRE